MRREEETKRTTEARQEEVVSMKDVRQECVDNPTMLLVAARLNAAITKAAIANVKEANESRHLLDFGQVAEEVTLYYSYYINDDTIEAARRELKNLLGWMFVSHVWYYTEIALDESRTVLTQT